MFYPGLTYSTDFQVYLEKISDITWHCVVVQEQIQWGVRAKPGEALQMSMHKKNLKNLCTHSKVEQQKV